MIAVFLLSDFQSVDSSQKLCYPLNRGAMICRIHENNEPVVSYSYINGLESYIRLQS